MKGRPVKDAGRNSIEEKLVMIKAIEASFFFKKFILFQLVFWSNGLVPVN